MILNVKNFQSICKTILLAVDNSNQKAANLEILVSNSILSLNVTNTEYYVSTKFNLDTTENFKAVVQAQKFLDLVASLTIDEIELTLDNNAVKLKAGKSSYKLPMIYENDKLMELPVIELTNKTVEMPISKDILQSILNVNSKEFYKNKAVDKDSLNELQKSYYITEDGCFTFTTGACLNSFKLDKPIKMVLNERIVRLFKLFTTDVNFSFGTDPFGNSVQTKIVMEADGVYLAAIISNEPVILNGMLNPYNAAKKYIEELYDNKIVVSTTALNSAISRLMTFNKLDKTVGTSVLFIGTIILENNELTIKDALDNAEVITVENQTQNNFYKMLVNLVDIKLILDACKEEFITINFGNHRSIVFTRNNINNLVPEITTTI